MYNLTVEASYPTPYASTQFLSLILMSMVGQKHTPNTKTEIRDSYDYIIVGGGSAGSVVASRLAEKDCVTVLLLEAGKSPPKVTDIPTIARSFIKTDIDWNYSTAPQKYTGAGLVNRSVAWPSGKAIGGSSVINAMLNVRGNKKNFDDWAANGATGWSYGEVLKYFKKLEDNVNPEYVMNGYHGIDGPVTVSKPEYHSELQTAVFEAARDMGYEIGDVNGPKQRGFYDLQATVRNGQRCSAAKAYLVPSEGKENLDIVSEAFVKKIIIDDLQARGVEFDFGGQTRQVTAKKEIIVSAGAVKSAQLLMLSGIGPKDELEKHNIPAQVYLPVGKNLQDHWAAMLGFELNDEIPSLADKQIDELNIQDYIKTKKGVLTSVQGIATIAFLNRDGLESPGDFTEYQLYFWEAATAPVKYQLQVTPEYYDAIYGPYENKTIYFCLSQILNPKGSGRVTLRSSNPYDSPIIDPMYFSHSDDLDVMVKGLKKCKEFGESEPLQRIGSKLFTTVYPGCEATVGNDDAYFRCMAESIVLTVSHPTGTAKMGKPADHTTVVDPTLRVKGIGSLRVVDASVMPSVTSGNTNVPTMMIAEKASDMIKETIQCPSDQNNQCFNY